MTYNLTQQEYDELMKCRARLMEAKELWAETGVTISLDNKTSEARINGLTIIHQDNRRALFNFFERLNMTNEL